MTILYQADFYDNNNISYNIEDIIDEQLEEKNKFVKTLVMGVIKERKEIDKLANKYLENWDISRLGYTDQAILRIGIYEILHTDTPDITCIDEAIELSHEYSDDKKIPAEIKNKLSDQCNQLDISGLTIDVFFDKTEEGIDALVISISGTETVSYGNETDHVIIGISYDKLNRLYVRKINM